MAAGTMTASSTMLDALSHTKERMHKLCPDQFEGKPAVLVMTVLTEALRAAAEPGAR